MQTATRGAHNVTHLSAYQGFVPCLVSRAEARHAARAEAAGIRDIHVEYAAQRLLSNTDHFAEFLGAECYGRQQVDSDRATRTPERLQAADTAELVHAALVAADRGDRDGCFEAMRLIAARYLIDADQLLQQYAAEAAEA